jgi:hypothetical protein
VGEGDELLADLARWAASERTAAAATSRLRERWLRQQATESARFSGLAVDLAEQEVVVSLRTVAGRTHHGIIEAVGRDFLVVRADGGPPTFIALDAIGLLRAAPGAGLPDADSDRTPTLDARLAHVLVGLAGERPRVLIVLHGGGDPVAGELRAAGEDVLTVLLDAEPPSRAYIPLAAVDELTLLG